MSFGLHVATDLNYSSILQGYVKVTVMVLGPGDEAPVSFGSLLRFFLFSYVGNSRLFIVTFCSTFVATGLLSTLLHLNKPTETRRFSDKKINCSIRDPRLKRICYVAGTTTHPADVI